MFSRSEAGKGSPRKPHAFRRKKRLSGRANFCHLLFFRAIRIGKSCRSGFYFNAAVFKAGAERRRGFVPPAGMDIGMQPAVAFGGLRTNTPPCDSP